ncbi:unnamed protein product [Dovyalis caffra]|uniref:NAC domain-containing protein n=1 Tax=Dovyalis caffra TaxID=77055 RepID=A0AAV1S9R1_9ROSI|nr:unnamed protein product [Dovyalis caffra]
MGYDLSSVLANPTSLMQLVEAGFKFQPSPEELISNYLVPKSRGDPVKGVPMAVVNLCKNEPWELPDKAIIKLADQEWYFFCPRDLKYKNSKLANRKTKAGHWKSTCKIKPIMAEHTKKKIGVMKTLTFYKTALPKAVRTEWMIYEFDLMASPTMYKKGQYVICRLENKSEDEKTKRDEQNNDMASVSDSEAEPSQSMASDHEEKNTSEMTPISACDESELSHHVASDHFETQKSNELMTNSARQVSELSHCMTSDLRNQNASKLMSNSAYDGSGSSYSATCNSETQYLNQPTVDSAYNGSKSHYKAFDSETQISNNMITVPTDEDQLLAYEKWLMAYDLKNQELPFQHEGESGPSVVMSSEFIKKSTSDSESNSLKAFDFKSQNLEKEIDISAFDEVDWSYLTASPPDFGNQNPSDVALPEASPELLAALEGFFDQENGPNTALDQTLCMEESHSYMCFDTSASA